jgi:YjbE family integral membrane protein
MMAHRLGEALMDLYSTQFAIALLQIIGINIVLSGDNAVVIALAARSLPPQQQKQAILWGSAGAVVMRIVLTFAAVELLQLPWLKLVGGILLLWIAVKLLLPERESTGHARSRMGFMVALRTILIADLVMSLDNVIAVAAAAKGSALLLVVGLAISIPLVIFGSTLLLKLIERYPAIIALGAALLGWVAGEMFVTDPLVAASVDATAPLLHWIGPAAGALFVVAFGKWLAARIVARRALEDLAAAAQPAVSEAPAPAGRRIFNRILVPVDASRDALRAVEYALAIWRSHPERETMQIHLLNVQRSLTGNVAQFVPKESLDSYHRERGEKALEAARRLLEEAGLKFSVHLLVGKPWELITDYAQRNAFDLIVMGRRGLGTHTAGALGSVATHVAQLTSVPVLLVPGPIPQADTPRQEAPRATPTEHRVSS